MRRSRDEQTRSGRDEEEPVQSDLPNQPAGMKPLSGTRKKPFMSRGHSIARQIRKLIRKPRSLHSLRDQPPLQNLSPMQCLHPLQDLLHRMSC